MQATYWKYKRLLGTSEVPDGAGSLAYFCPICGEIWGRIQAGDYWRIVHACCRDHAPSGVQEWSHPPGSFLSPYGTIGTNLAMMYKASEVRYMPVEVLREEVLLQINLLEAQNDTDDTNTD